MGRINEKPNPFTTDRFKTKRRFKPTGFGSKAIVDTETGEVESVAMFAATEKDRVDTETFIKLYQPCIVAMRNMPSNSFDIFMFILNKLQYSETVRLNTSDLMAYGKYKHKNSVYTGLRWLVENKFIAKKNGDIYYVNHHFIYRGNRLKIKQNGNNREI